MAKSYKYKRSRKALDLDTCKLRMTDAIKAIEKIILTTKDDQKLIQAANTLSGLIKRHAEILKTSDLEKRIEALEEKL